MRGIWGDRATSLEAETGVARLVKSRQTAARRLMIMRAQERKQKKDTLDRERLKTDFPAAFEGQSHMS